MINHRIKVQDTRCRILRSTLKWPEGPQDYCAVCGEQLVSGERVAVVDQRYYEEHFDGGIYAHAICVQEVGVKKGDYCPVRNYGGD